MGAMSGVPEVEIVAPHRSEPKGDGAVLGNRVDPAAASDGGEPYGGCSSMVEHWTVTPGVAGSSPVSHPIQLDGLACTGYTAPPSAADRYGSVAQLAEQWTLNP